MKTATIERCRVYGTPNHCLALFYRGKELTPTDKPALVGHRALPKWIPSDVAGIEEIKAHAKRLGFTHVRFTGTWYLTPKACALA